jgi:hypothetical protein
MTWYNPNWSYRKLITIKSSVVYSNQTNFPTLFRISGIGTKSLVDGKDIVFVDSDDTTRFHHDLVSFYDYTGNVWIQIPTLTTSTAKNFYMYYGNLTGGDQTNINGYRPSNTWDDSYSFVCHMNDGGDDVTVPYSKQLMDSTANRIKLYKSDASYPLMVKTFAGSGQKWYNKTNHFISSCTDSLNHARAFNKFSGQIVLELIVSGMRSACADKETRGYMLSLHNKGYSPVGVMPRYHELSVRGPGAPNYNIPTNNIGFSISCQHLDGGYNTSIANEYGWPGSGCRTTSRVGFIQVSAKSGGSASADERLRCYIDGHAPYNASLPTGRIWNQAKGVFMGQSWYPGTIDQGYSFSGTIIEARVLNRTKDYGYQWMQYTCISSVACEDKHPVVYTIGSEVSKPVGTTSFNSMDGSATSWKWDTVEVNVGYAPRSDTQGGTRWKWGIVTGDPATYIPSGNAKQWSWCVENA